MGTRQRKLFCIRLKYYASVLTVVICFYVKTLKTYTRHSGGVLTGDLVNEVLKDSDVPPIIGTGYGLWSTIDCDGAFFFPFVSKQQVTKHSNLICTVFSFEG